MSSKFQKIGFFRYIHIKICSMDKIIKPLGCEVHGIDLKTENSPKSNIDFKFKLQLLYLLVHLTVIEQIRKDVTEHRILIFKNQGVISGERHVEISRWFGDLESTFYKHSRSPHPDVFRVSNDKNEGCTGIQGDQSLIRYSLSQKVLTFFTMHQTSNPKMLHYHYIFCHLYFGSETITHFCFKITVYIQNSINR